MIYYYIPWLYNAIKSFKKTFNSKKSKTKNWKPKITETQKTKTQKDKSLFLLKEKVENADLYKPILWPLTNNA